MARLEADAISVVMALAVVFASVVGHENTSRTLFAHAVGNCVLCILASCCSAAGVARHPGLSTRFDADIRDS